MNAKFVLSCSLLLAAAASAAVETAVPATERLLERDGSRPVIILTGYGYGPGEMALLRRHAQSVTAELVSRGPQQLDIWAVFLVTTNPPADANQRRLDQQRAVRLAVQAMTALGRGTADGLLMDRDRFSALYPEPPPPTTITPGTPTVGAPSPQFTITTGILVPSAVYDDGVFVTKPGTTSATVTWSTGYYSKSDKPEDMAPRHDVQCELRVTEGQRGGAYRVLANGPYGQIDVPVQPNTTYHFELFFTAPYTWQFGPDSTADYESGDFVPFSYAQLAGPVEAAPPPPPPPPPPALTPGTPTVGAPGPRELISTGIIAFPLEAGATSARAIWSTGIDTSRNTNRHDAQCELRLFVGDRDGPYTVIAAGAFGEVRFPVQANTTYHLALHFTAPYLFRFTGNPQAVQYAAGDMVPFCYAQVDGPVVAAPPPPPPPPPASIVQPIPIATANLTAFPNPVSVPAGGLGSTVVTWVAGGAYRLTVQVEGEAQESLFSQGGAGQGIGSAPWIQAGRSYVFRLYVGDALLSQVTVRGVAPPSPPVMLPPPPPALPPMPAVPPASGEISASPQVVMVPAGALGSTTLSWAVDGDVWVKHESTLGYLASGGPGSAEPTWIQKGQTYVFKLFPKGTDVAPEGAPAIVGLARFDIVPALGTVVVRGE